MHKAWLVGMLAALVAAMPATAQVRTVDPNNVIDGDLAPPPDDARPPQQAEPDERYTPPVDRTIPAQNGTSREESTPQYPADTPSPAPSPGTGYAPAQTGNRASGPTPRDTTTAADTYEREDLIGAAEGVFGKGAAGLAQIIQNILKDQGEPNAYIAGREASGAFVVGLRYGSGIMHHRIEGERPVYWTGPSVGFDVGGDAAKVFVLVYNLYDSQELYKRFPQVEGRAYFVGGFSASYMRSGDVVLIPVRLGVGWRLGANIGYMKFTEKGDWLPF